MSQDGKRAGKRPRLYEIIVVSLGEIEKTRSYRVSRVTLALLGVLTFLLCVGLTLVVLIFTPVAMYVPIPNPLLEERYGRQIVETQERLNSLAEEVLILRDYNTQLRKAMGEPRTGDSAGVAKLPPSLILDGGGPRPRAETRAPVEKLPLAEQTAASMDEGSAGYTPSGMELGENVHPRLPLSAPTDGYVSQGFDPGRGHYGMDFAGKRGTPIHAAGDGVVVFSGWTYEDGNMLIIAHSGGISTVYKHNQALLKNVHSTVKHGEVVALLGSSGKTSYGPHLHFEVWKDGIPQDPNEYLLRPLKAQ
jgi:murein DD-endopeptidase MepM/ murein hydrolase activator NlpD